MLLPTFSFAANLSRPPPTDAELQAAELFNSAPAIAERRQEDGSATASATDETATITANPFEKEDYATLLGRALVKLHVQNLSTMHHDPLYSAYHYSHPTLAERLQALRPFELANQEKKEQ